MVKAQLIFTDRYKLSDYLYFPKDVVKCLHSAHSSFVKIFEEENLLDLKNIVDLAVFRELGWQW